MTKHDGKTEFQAWVLMGRSAAGKGTQASLLQDFLKRQHPDLPEPVFSIETGARFREYIKGDSYSSQRSHKLYIAGELQPAFIASWIWSDLIIKNYKGNQHWVIDGTPRTLAEALTFDSALRFYGFNKPKIVLLDIPNDVAHDRLVKRGRPEDDLDREKNQKRLDWFETEVMPAVDFFRHNKDYHFVTLDGTAGIEKIHEQIVALA